MPNIKSAKKRVRQTDRRTDVNRIVRARMNTLVRTAFELIEAKDANAAKAVQTAQSAIDKATKRHIIHKSTASRKIARLNRLLKAITQK